MLRRGSGAAVVIATIAVVAAGTALVAVRRRYLVVTVSGASMEPALFDGDRVLVRAGAARTPRRGDVVVLWTPSFQAGRDAPPPGAAPARDGRSIKRVVAVPGDPLPPAAAEACGRPAGTPVPAGRLVVLGDARHSYDSRSWGFLPVERLVGVVVRRLAAYRRW
ncbi:S26 family signal peptidase [Streptosporangium sp. NPDC023615]|uniref:S26 family signal peptidase n=1 Tax=Streptosporangium sp. NPDC023615 TaxID=3154794 RepID=UPI003426C7C8